MIRKITNLIEMGIHTLIAFTLSLGFIALILFFTLLLVLGT